MNKIASINYLMRQGVPTLPISVINNSRVEMDVREIYRPNDLGWVVRCGQEPDDRGKIEKGMPWHVAKNSEEVVAVVRDFYSSLPRGHYVFIHPQRDMNRSGNLLVDGENILIEAVSGWPKALSHGEIMPESTYSFNAPSMFFSEDFGCEFGNTLSRQDLFLLGTYIERRLNYETLSLTDPLVLEFSFDSKDRISAHDIRVQ